MTGITNLLRKTIPWLISGVALVIHACWELSLHERVVARTAISFQRPYVAVDEFTSRGDFTYWMEVDHVGSNRDSRSITYTVLQDGKPVPFSFGVVRHRPNTARFEGKRGKTYRVEAHIATLPKEQQAEAPYLKVEMAWSDSCNFQLFYNFLKMAGLFLTAVGVFQILKPRSPNVNQ